MESMAAIKSLSALGHEKRLEVFRLLVSAEPHGMKPTGMLDTLANLPASSLSSYLSILKDADLITRERISREILYRANMDHVQALILFLVADCCGGRADLCEPMLSKLIPACG